MATRWVFDVIKKRNGKEKRISRIYVHSDGYPDGFPLAVAEFLAKREIVNGYNRTFKQINGADDLVTSIVCLLYTSPSPRDRQKSRMPSSA